MFLRNFPLTQASFQVSHLFKNERIVRQSPEGFFVRLERALKVARNAVAINALRQPGFPELGLEGYRPIRGLLHCSAGVCLGIKTVEIKIAARDAETGP